MREILPLLLFPVFLFTTPSFAQTPFERMDRNGDGKLSSTEFRGPSRALKRMDRDRDGYISHQEAAGTRLTSSRVGRKPAKNKLNGKESTELLYVDTHNHLVGPSRSGKLNFGASARNALESMNAASVKLNFIMPMPQAVGQKLKLRFEDLLPVIEQYPDRFAALGGASVCSPAPKERETVLLKGIR